jgi:hypothetical protein
VSRQGSRPSRSLGHEYQVGQKRRRNMIETLVDWVAPSISRHRSHMTYVSLQFSSKPILGGRSEVTGGETHLLLDELAGLHPRRGRLEDTGRC